MWFYNHEAATLIVLFFCWRNTDHPYLFCGEKDTHCHQGTTISVKRLGFGGPRFTTDLLFYVTRGSTVSNPGQLLGIWVVFTFLGFIFFVHLVWILSVTCTRNTLVATDRTEVYAPYQIVFTFTCKHSILPLEFGFWALTSFLPVIYPSTDIPGNYLFLVSRLFLRCLSYTYELLPLRMDLSLPPLILRRQNLLFLLFHNLNTHQNLSEMVQTILSILFTPFLALPL